MSNESISIQQALEYEKAFKEGRQLGMLQERALWNLTESTQEIENSHPAKTLTDEEIIEICQLIGIDPTSEYIWQFARAILRKAQEK